MPERCERERPAPTSLETGARVAMAAALVGAFVAMPGCSNSPTYPPVGYYSTWDGQGYGGLPQRNYDVFAGDAQGRSGPDAGGAADGASAPDVSAPVVDAAAAGDVGPAGQDAGPTDSGGWTDAVVTDSGPLDAGPLDAGATDAGLVDLGPTDAGQPDIGKPDVGKPDTGSVPFGEDVPWGSDPNVPPYDAGQYEYDIVGGGGPGPGLCNPAFTDIDLEKKKVGGKVDIIIFVDTSGSMGQEASWTNAQMNNFANYLVGKNIDFRVILLEKDTSCCKMCIQPPLGGPNCGNNPPKFIHHKGIAMPVYSTDGLKDVIASYSAWKMWLRPDATKNFIAVTDDNSSLSAAAFQSQLMALDNQDKVKGLPEQFQKTAQTPEGFVFHSIVAYNTTADCPTLAKKGTVYLELTAKTNGAKFKICEKNWTPIFQNLATAVSMTAKPGCTYPLQKPPGVQSSDDLSLVYVAEDDDFPVPFGPGNICPPSGVGFTFDNPNNPSQVTLCPGSCSKLNGGGTLVFNFGCG